MSFNKLFNILRILRYRFFLLAGIFPYLLGTAIAYEITQSFNPFSFLLGFFGLIFAFVGIESFNEYFDLDVEILFKKRPSKHIFFVGMFSLVGAFSIASYLALNFGWFVLFLATLGSFFIIFYVAPPLRLAYRGFGEFSIYLSYGLLIPLGGYYLQTLEITLKPILPSLLSGLLILTLALINEIPDFYKDIVVGKKNITVRIGKRKVITICEVLLYSFFILVGLGVVFRQLPSFSLLIFTLLPLAYKNILIAKSKFDHPEKFIPAIRGTMYLYVLTFALLITSYLI